MNKLNFFSARANSGQFLQFTNSEHAHFASSICVRAPDTIIFGDSNNESTVFYGTPQLSYVSFFAAIVTNFITCSTSFVMCSKNFFMCSTNFVMRSKNFFMCSTKFVMCSKNFFMCSKNSGCGEICDYCGRFLILWSFRPVNHRNFCLHAIGKFTMDYTLDSLAWKQKEKWRATRGKRSLGFFAALHSLSTADFAKPSRHKKARTTIEGGRLFELDRLVSARKGKEVSLLAFTSMLCLKM